MKLCYKLQDLKLSWRHDSIKLCRASSRVKRFKIHDVSGDRVSPRNVVCFKSLDAAGGPRKFYVLQVVNNRSCYRVRLPRRSNKFPGSPACVCSFAAIVSLVAKWSHRDMAKQQTIALPMLGLWIALFHVRE